MITRVHMKMSSIGFQTHRCPTDEIEITIHTCIREMLTHSPTSTRVMPVVVMSTNLGVETSHMVRTVLVYRMEAYHHWMSREADVDEHWEVIHRHPAVITSHRDHSLQMSM